ncbi:hypothetical protein C8R44DRAFT_749185 [Mycena epipterygia]|nr:hypothetical protein C8R44DRAFT_749185 [Mycena epipterygia]
MRHTLIVGVDSVSDHEVDDSALAILPRHTVGERTVLSGVRSARSVPKRCNKGGRGRYTEHTSSLRVCVPAQDRKMRKMRQRDDGETERCHSIRIEASEETDESDDSESGGKGRKMFEIVVVPSKQTILLRPRAGFDPTSDVRADGLENISVHVDRCVVYQEMSVIGPNYPELGEFSGGVPNWREIRKGGFPDVVVTNRRDLWELN